MILRITSSFEFIGNKIQQLCLRYPWLVRIYGFFFDYSSRITYLFLITRGGLAFNLVFPTLMTVFHLREFAAFYSQIQGKGWLHFYSIALETFSLDYLLMYVFYMILIEITIINTLLVHAPVIREYMISRYGPDILKERGYNTMFRTAKNLFSIGGSVVVASVVAVGSYHQLHLETLEAIKEANQHIYNNNAKILNISVNNFHEYNTNYLKYLEVSKTIPNLVPPTMPPKPTLMPSLVPASAQSMLPVIEK